MFGARIRKFFGQFGAEAPSGHSLSLTPAMAAEVRKIAAEQKLNLAVLSVLVGQKPNGEHTLDLIEDLVERTSPANALAISNGLFVILPRHLVDTYADATIHAEHGGFRFNGPNLPNFVATDPGGMTVSRAALARFCPEFARDTDAVARFDYHMIKGDCSSAVVVSLNPLVVAAYASDLDDVALLKFPRELVVSRKVGERLLTVNSFQRGDNTAADLIRGPRATKYFWNFTPVIAEFFAAEQDLVVQRKSELSKELWTIAADHAFPAMARARGRYRNGLPPHSAEPAYTEV